MGGVELWWLLGSGFVPVTSEEEEEGTESERQSRDSLLLLLIFPPKVDKCCLRTNEKSQELFF